jgi:SNF-related kinase
VLRGAVRDLDMQLEDNLRVRDKEPDQQLPLTVEDGVVLLDYLVTYFQLTALILD